MIGIGQFFTGAISGFATDFKIDLNVKPNATQVKELAISYKR